LSLSAAVKRIVLMLLVALPLFAAPAEKFSFQVLGIDCALCAPPIVKALQSIDGVTNPNVDWKTKTATVEIPAGFDKERIRTALSDAGFAPIFPGELRKEIEPLPADVVKTLDIQTWTDGHRADIAKIVAPGKVTIVDFYADWCGPCTVLETRLEHFMQARKDIALRRVNIGKWDNEAAKQATKEFHVEALPYIRLYDANGKFVASVTGGMWDEVLGAIEKAGRK
jgi:copper chaperone CopZ